MYKLWRGGDTLIGRRLHNHQDWASASARWLYCSLNNTVNHHKPWCVIARYQSYSWGLVLKPLVKIWKGIGGKKSTLAGKNPVQINIYFKHLHQEHSTKSRRDVCLQNQHVYKTWIERNAPGASMISRHKDAFVSKFVPEGISVTQRTLNIGHIMLGWVLWVNHIYCQIDAWDAPKGNMEVTIHIYKCKHLLEQRTHPLLQWN